MDAPTIVAIDSSNPEIVAELAEQREKDRELAMWKRFGILGFDNYVKWVLSQEPLNTAHF